METYELKNSSSPLDNRISVLFDDGNQIDFHGGNYGLNFFEMDEYTIQDFLGRFLVQDEDIPSVDDPEPVEEPLSDSESVQKLQEWLSEHTDADTAAAFSGLVRYVDHTARQLEQTARELEDVKQQLYTLQEQDRPRFRPLSSLRDSLTSAVERQMEMVYFVRDRIRNGAQRYLDSAERLGVSAASQVVSFFNVKDNLNNIRSGLTRTAQTAQELIGRVEAAGQELRNATGHLQNAARSLTGEEAQEASTSAEGSFQAGLLAPLRGVQSLLTDVEKTIGTAVGHMENLERLAEAQPIKAVQENTPLFLARETPAEEFEADFSQSLGLLTRAKTMEDAVDINQQIFSTIHQNQELGVLSLPDAQRYSQRLDERMGLVEERFRLTEDLSLHQVTPFYGMIERLYSGGVGERLFYLNREEYSNMIAKCVEAGDPISFSEVDKETYQKKLLEDWQERMGLDPVNGYTILQDGDGIAVGFRLSETNYLSVWDKDGNGEYVNQRTGSYNSLLRQEGMDEVDFTDIRDVIAELDFSLDPDLPRPISRQEEYETWQREHYGENSFAIYQMPVDTGKYTLEPLERLTEAGFTPQRENYELVYAGWIWNGETPEDLRARFSGSELPAGYTGRPVGVGDVIVRTWQGPTTAYYVESDGFKELANPMEYLPTPDFESQQPPAETGSYEQAAYTQPGTSHGYGIGRAEQLIDRIEAERGRTVFDAADQNLLANYAYHIGDDSKLAALAEGLASANLGLAESFAQALRAQAEADINEVDREWAAGNIQPQQSSVPSEPVPPTVRVSSVVIQTYKTDPQTHRITATHTRTGEEVFGDLRQRLDSLGMLRPDFIDYFEPYPEYDLQRPLPEDAYFTASSDWGGSEGIYADISISYTAPDGTRRTEPFATCKTLAETTDAYFQMARISASSQLLLGGNGRELELPREPVYAAEPLPETSSPDRPTVYVCSPLAGEMEENIRRAREYSRYVAQQGNTPLAPHITELFNDAVPEEREMGLRMGLDYLRKADELWVFGNRVSSGMEAEIRLARDELHIPIYQVDPQTYLRTPYSAEPAQPKGEQRMTQTQTAPSKNFTRSQLDRAKEVDLLTYIENHGYTVKQAGSGAYRLIEDGHDSLTIFPSTNSWYDFRNEIGGDSVSFLVKHEGKNMVDAVHELIGESFDPQQLISRPRPEPEEYLPAELPEHAENNRRAYAYLIKTRCIDRDIVKRCMDEGLIYESVRRMHKGEQEYEFHNCVFVGQKDGHGNPGYASQRSMNDSSGHVFKMDVPNSSKEFGFLLRGKEDAGWLTVCEAPIDALSVASLYKMKGQPYDNEHILALGGVSDNAVDHFLADNKNIKVINICLDNDEAGRQAGERLRQKYESLGYQVVESYPTAKDYNLELQQEVEKQNTPHPEIPAPSADNRRSFQYLTETKRLDPELVKAAFHRGDVYQSVRQSPDGSKTFADVTFISRAENGVPVYGISVSQNQNPERADFRIEYRDPEASRSWLEREGKSGTLVVFNNPISMLTYQTIQNAKKVERPDHCICAVTKQGRAVHEYLEAHPEIGEVKVKLEASAAIDRSTGQPVDFREIAFKQITRGAASVNKSVKVTKQYPKGIDLNRDLQQSLQKGKTAPQQAKGRQKEEAEAER